MSDVFSYDESVAEDAHGNIMSVANGLEATLNDLTSFVNQVKSNWQGDEQEQYAQIQAQWDSSAQEVRNILNQVRDALGHTTSSVQQMRGQVRSALQK